MTIAVRMLVILTGMLVQCRYILATSVVKDLVVLLDTGQQEDTTFKAATNVVTELFDTFTAADSVNVVAFNSTRATLLQPISVYFLPAQYPATSRFTRLML